MTIKERDQLLDLVRKWKSLPSREHDYAQGRKDQRDDCAEELNYLVDELYEEAGSESL